LPTTPVDLTIINPEGIDYPFDIQLSDVPSGFDVTNGVYVGWCVDLDNYIARDDIHSVRLYSSLSPPAEIQFNEWNMINYILNHKQGTAEDIQSAI